jgi:hypothetical protein
LLKAHIYKSMTLNGRGCADCDEDHRRAFFGRVSATKVGIQRYDPGSAVSSPAISFALTPAGD